MGFMDKIKEFAGKNPDKVEQGLGKAGDAIDAKTDGKYQKHVDTAQQKAGEYLTGGQGGQPEGQQPPA